MSRADKELQSSAWLWRSEDGHCNGGARRRVGTAGIWEETAKQTRAMAQQSNEPTTTEI